MGVLFALLSAASWGVSNVFARKAQLKGGADQWSGLFITLAVNNAMNLALFSLSLFFRLPFSLNASGLLFFAAGGLLNSFIGRGLIFLAISRLGAPKAGVIKGFTPVFVLLGGVFLLKETLDTADFLGIFLAILGVMAVSADMLRSDRAQRKDTGVAGVSWKGILIGLAATLFLGSGNLCRKAGISHIPDPLLGVTAGGLAGLVFITAFFLCTGRMKAALKALRHMDGGYLLAGITTGLALYFLFLALNTLPVSVANSFTASEPLFTLLASILILKKQDRVTWLPVLGGALVILGAVVLILL